MDGRASPTAVGTVRRSDTDFDSSIRGRATPAASDEVMTDDMKLAVSALGLLRNHDTETPTGREGGEPGSGGSSSSWTSAPHLNPPQLVGSSVRRPPPPLGEPPSRQHLQYRSTSTASTSTASDAWGTASSSTFPHSGSETGTGTSSPVTTTSIAPSDVELDGEGTLADGGESRGDLKRGTLHRTDSATPDAGEETEGDAKFIERVSQLPLVSGGLEWYERSKANSRVVKYGAGLVESSFSAVSRPITNNLQLGPLDDFACRQLDRIGAPVRSPSRKDGEALRTEEDGQSSREKTPPTNPRRRSDDDDARSEGSTGGGGQVTVQQGQRSRWQTVLVEAGGLGAAVSEESLKSLRYCLQWLVYATAHLDHQISTLRDFILSLRAHNRAHPSSAGPERDRIASTALVAASASAHLTQIKHDVVETIRKVVEVVSKYAGAALPEQAKRYVKQSIMGLPVKWASAIENKGPSRGGGGMGGSGMNRRLSESETPTVERMGDAYFKQPGGEPSATSTRWAYDRSREQRDRDEAEAEARAALGPTEEAADRVLTFAVESLDMLRSVASIFGESVEKAEAWIERLRIVGLQRQRERREQEHQQQGEQFSIEPPPPTSTTGTSSSLNWIPSDLGNGGGMKRRRGATQAGQDSHGESLDGEFEQDRRNVDGDGAMTDGDEPIAHTRRKRGARSREMSAQLS